MVVIKMMSMTLFSTAIVIITTAIIITAIIIITTIIITVIIIITTIIITSIVIIRMMQVLGDPTVEVFASRDVDSFLLPRCSDP